MKQILVESSYGSIWREIMEGITWFARDRRLAWQINCVTTQELAGAIKSRPHGAICSLRRANRALVSQLVVSRLPAVNILRDIHPSVPSVMSDNEVIGENAADHLYSKGFRRFGFVGINRFWSDERERGFRRRLSVLGCEMARCPVRLEIDAMRPFKNIVIQRELKQWLSCMPRPAAVFSCADSVGVAVIEACCRARISVPKEVAILGVDNDLAICDLAPIPLSSIPQNMRRIGFESARLLDAVMHRRQRKAALKIAPREVIVRRSTDFMAIENPQVAAAMRYINTTNPEQLDMKGVLRQVGVSRQWLDKQFRQIIGTTASEEIRRQKLACARSLLLDSHLTVHAVAVRSGFTQGVNLSRFFKNHLGISPGEFRRKHGFVE